MSGFKRRPATLLRQGESLLRAIGKTPFIPIEGFKPGPARIWAKLEWGNPFGSLKDRAAYWMLKEAEKAGSLVRGQNVVIEPTSGNTGIALAGIARAMGYGVEVVIPNKTSEETKAILRSIARGVIETEDDLCPRVGPGTDQSIALAEAIVKGNPGRYFMPNQYENEANFLAHYSTTGPEIWGQTMGRVTRFVTGIGTGGTVTGVAQFLKERNPGIRVYGVEPERGHHLQGLRNLEESRVPKLLERRIGLIDEAIRVSDEEAFSAVRELAKREGLLVGPSSGAVMSAALRIAERGDGVTVCIFADDGRKYRSVYTRFNVFTPEEFSSLTRKARCLSNLSFEAVV